MTHPADKHVLPIIWSTLINTFIIGPVLSGTRSLQRCVSSERQPFAANDVKSLEAYPVN